LPLFVMNIIFLVFILTKHYAVLLIPIVWIDGKAALLGFVQGRYKEHIRYENYIYLKHINSNNIKITCL
ncbi:hypothetical protein ACJX0J_029151, partial [Zea mays]